MNLWVKHFYGLIKFRLDIRDDILQFWFPACFFLNVFFTFLVVIAVSSFMCNPVYWQHGCSARPKYSLLFTYCSLSVLTQPRTVQGIPVEKAWTQLKNVKIIRFTLQSSLFFSGGGGLPPISRPPPSPG